ncbi:MAG TPA: class III poly(R)-hydroxyalkanoic acid synthase subunit PhaE [Lysobacter sp.]|nr:class III poly(R)-hydroxyalkanoic acid synthase subunit PhaE [Lysobacter sp.]
MTASGNGFESLARQYWSAWGEALRAGAAPASPGVPDWKDAVDWWSKLAHGGRTEANDAVERFNRQARDWYGQMQQLAAQFAGRDAGAADIAAEWKRALGASGENPFPEMFRAMRGSGARGLEQWVEDASPWLDAMRREAGGWLGVPTFGLGREHQERLQKLAQAQLDLQQCESAYNALMLKALQRAYELFESKLAEREEPGRQLKSARELFDLWIDAAEEAYADIALSPEFRDAYGAMVNAQMRLRAGVQEEVELAGAMFGMPTRTEVDAAHRKIAELERALRRMRDAQPEPRREAPRPAAKPATKKPAARKSVAKKSVVKASAAKAVKSARRNAFADIAPPALHKASKGAKR